MYMQYKATVLCASRMLSIFFDMKFSIISPYRNMRKWIRNKLYPHESEQDTTTPSSHQKQTKNRDKEIKKQKLQQYCAQQCQQEYHELYSLKDVLQNRTGPTSPRKEAFLKSRSQGSPVQQKTHQILVCISLYLFTNYHNMYIFQFFAFYLT